MTTTVMPSEPATPGQPAPGQPTSVAAADGNPFRTISIAADLLPEEIVAARSVRKYRRIVISGLVGVLVLLAGWYGIVTVQTGHERSTLRAQEREVTALTRRQNSFADVINAQARSRVIKSQLGSLLAEDLRWSAVLSAVQSAAPPEVKVTGVYGGLLSAASGTGGPAAGTTSGAASGASSAGANGAKETLSGTGLPNTTGEKIIGSLTVTGSAPDKARVAEYVDALAKASGLGNPLLADLNVQDGQYRFTVRLDLTAAALGGRFTTEGGK